MEKVTVYQYQIRTQTRDFSPPTINVHLQRPPPIGR
jgi:hypothetical protein